MSQAFGTKAETLFLLRERGFSVPPLQYFTAEVWAANPDAVLDRIQSHFPQGALAVRSSARCEDGEEASQAGAFQSVLHVPATDREHLTRAVETVIASFNSGGCGQDQVLIQPMIERVHMSGVVMTRVLDDGSPYYVVNYDDTSGRTDTVTGGAGISKTVYIYKGAKPEDFDSPRLWAVLELARRLERTFADVPDAEVPLDIEFAVDDALNVHLLQVRRICTVSRWKARVATAVSRRIRFVEDFVSSAMRPRPGLFGNKTLFGVMPDWNPAEIIGVAPRPLAMSLYRDLITRRTWSKARESMGYRPLPAADLMISLAGRPYIDVRASFNSFLPAGLNDAVCGALVGAWLQRLESHPEFHDKVEFDVVHTVMDLDFDATFDERYPGLLPSGAREAYKNALRALTCAALSFEQRPGGLRAALAEIEILRARQTGPAFEQLAADAPLARQTPFELVAHLATLLEDCRTLGALPFAVAARHAFLAEAVLRSAVRRGALGSDRLDEFKRGIRTVSGELSDDFRQVCSGKLEQSRFLARYGHLRPGTYDILTPCYARLSGLFDGSGPPPVDDSPASPFALSKKENNALRVLLQENLLPESPARLLDYAATAIAGREYAKFVFTRHLSAILEVLAVWGAGIGLSRAQMALLSVDEVLSTLYAPLAVDNRRHFLNRIREGQQLHDLTRSFQLAQLIRSTRDVYVAAQPRSEPNFITAKSLSAPVRLLDNAGGPLPDPQALVGRIACIESADPGYDWIFTRGIAGLITRFGGSNSHMAIRCAEYGLPAAIGCGGTLFDKITLAERCLLDCAAKVVRPL